MDISELEKEFEPLSLISNPNVSLYNIIRKKVYTEKTTRDYQNTVARIDKIIFDSLTDEEKKEYFEYTQAQKEDINNANYIDEVIPLEKLLIKYFKCIQSFIKMAIETMPPGLKNNVLRPYRRARILSEKGMKEELRELAIDEIKRNQEDGYMYQTYFDAEDRDNMIDSYIKKLTKYNVLTDKKEILTSFVLNPTISVYSECYKDLDCYKYNYDEDEESYPKRLRVYDLTIHTFDTECLGQKCKDKTSSSIWCNQNIDYLNRNLFKIAGEIFTYTGVDFEIIVNGPEPPQYLFVDSQNISVSSHPFIKNSKWGLFKGIKYKEGYFTVSIEDLNKY